MKQFVIVYVIVLFFLPISAIGVFTDDQKIETDDGSSTISLLVDYDPVIAEMIQMVNESTVETYIQTLQDFGPRVTGSQASTEASEYLYNQFSSMNLSVTYDPWNSGGYNDRNVEAILDGTNASSNKIFVVCGHFDSVSGSPGADDNAGGTAAVVTAAKVLSGYDFEHTVKFVAFSGEEQGLLGSYHYAGEASSNGDNIIAALNADMIGYTATASGGTTVKIFENVASQWITDLATTISATYQDEIGLTVSQLAGSGNSDHYPFWSNGFDAIFYHEYEFNPYYHSPNDTIDHMNLTYDAIVTRLIIATLAELAVPSGPRENDVGIEDISSPLNNGSYPSGIRDITAIVKNYGLENQTDFNVSCEVIEIIKPINVTEQFFDDMENGINNWSVEGDFMLWELGIPSNVGPSSSHSPLNCWGTIIDDYYGQDEIDEYLVSSPIHILPCDTATFVFYSWYNIENGYDGGIIEVNNGLGWEQIDPNNDQHQYDSVLKTGYGNTLEGKWALTGSSLGWERKTFDISDYINQTIQIRFHFGTDVGVHDYPGWYIDDISIFRIEDAIEQLVFTNEKNIMDVLSQNESVTVSWEHNFQNITQYRISVETLLEGDQSPFNNNKKILITVTELQHDIALYGGWNLITIPFENSWTAESLGKNISGCNLVLRFNGSTQSFETYVVGSGYDDFPIVDGVGYFVRVSSDTLFSCAGLSISGVNVTLYDGWNTLGWFHEYLSSAQSLGENTSASLVLMFNATTQDFMTYVMNSGYDNFIITRGMGVFIQTSTGGWWHGEG